MHKPMETMHHPTSRRGQKPLQNGTHLGVRYHLLHRYDPTRNLHRIPSPQNGPTRGPQIPNPRRLNGGLLHANHRPVATLLRQNPRTLPPKNHEPPRRNHASPKNRDRDSIFGFIDGTSRFGRKGETGSSQFVSRFDHFGIVAFASTCYDGILRGVCLYRAYRVV